MNVEDWQEQNGRYLSASLHWLRLRMQQLEREQRTAPGPALSGQAAAESQWSLDEMAGELAAAAAGQPEIEHGSAPAGESADRDRSRAGPRPSRRSGIACSDSPPAKKPTTARRHPSRK